MNDPIDQEEDKFISPAGIVLIIGISIIVAIVMYVFLVRYKMIVLNRPVGKIDRNVLNDLTYTRSQLFSTRNKI